ncbi:acyltransferase [Priestia aryabhattai]|uniref:acyltransferase n=1 Tax=Priestia aryabhattai TaxID=412384 RepID=UPI001ADAFEEF|nr:acyltransferase [Priestia aryabhattai]QTL50590.1 acyltransferase [Priestia aryabhattai]
MRKKLKLFYYKLYKYFGNKHIYCNDIAIREARLRGVTVGTNCRFFCTNFSSEEYLIKIGNHVTVTNGVQFITHDGGAWVLRGLDEKYKYTNIIGKIEVGNNVFIGMNSIILPGIKIGDNCIVAAGSIVTKSIPPNSIVGGNPAKLICKLDDYITKNKHTLIDTKQYTESEKKAFILNNLDKLVLKAK